MRTALSDVMRDYRPALGYDLPAVTHGPAQPFFGTVKEWGDALVAMPDGKFIWLKEAEIEAFFQYHGLTTRQQGPFGERFNWLEWYRRNRGDSARIKIQGADILSTASSRRGVPQFANNETVIDILRNASKPSRLLTDADRHNTSISPFTRIAAASIEAGDVNIHYLTHEEFIKVGGNIMDYGHHKLGTNDIYIDVGKLGSAEELASWVLHEYAHFVDPRPFSDPSLSLFSMEAFARERQYQFDRVMQLPSSHYENWYAHDIFFMRALFAIYPPTVTIGRKQKIQRWW
jgi:hypothetical protein